MKKNEYSLLNFVATVCSMANCVLSARSAAHHQNWCFQTHLDWGRCFWDSPHILPYWSKSRLLGAGARVIVELVLFNLHSKAWRRFVGKWELDASQSIALGEGAKDMRTEIKVSYKEDSQRSFAGIGNTETSPLEILKTQLKMKLSYLLLMTYFWTMDLRRSLAPSIVLQFLVQCSY